MDELEIEQLKNAGLTYEEIQGVIEAEQNIIDGDVYTEEEIYDFIDNELFSNIYYMNTSQINIEAYKKAGFTYEEIQGVIEAKQNILDGEVYSEEEIYDFIDNELLGKYKINA